MLRFLGQLRIIGYIHIRHRVLCCNPLKTSLEFRTQFQGHPTYFGGIFVEPFESASHPGSHCPRPTPASRRSPNLPTVCLRAHVDDVLWASYLKSRSKERSSVADFSLRHMTRLSSHELEYHDFAGNRELWMVSPAFPAERCSLIENGGTFCRNWSLKSCPSATHRLWAQASNGVQRCRWYRYVHRFLNQFGISNRRHSVGQDFG